MLQRGIALAFLFPLAACSAPPTRAADESTTIEAYYRGALFTASYRELDDGAEAAGADVSVLYQADAGLVGGARFVSVLSATSSGPEPVWHEVQLSGNECAPGELCAAPVQYTSVEEILAAAQANEIHLVPTDTRCSVLGVRPMTATLQR